MKIEIRDILKQLYWQGRRHHELPITDISVESELEQICRLFPKSEDNPDGYEPKQIYTLTCDQCGRPFNSSDAFPSPQLCSNCSKPQPDESRLEEVRQVITKAVGYGQGLAREKYDPNNYEATTFELAEEIYTLFEQVLTSVSKEKELRKAIKNAPGLYLHPDDEDEALDGIISIIKEVCWLKGEQELPTVLYPSQELKLKEAGFKPCQEWEK